MLLISLLKTQVNKSTIYIQIINIIYLIINYLIKNIKTK